MGEFQVFEVVVKNPDAESGDKVIPVMSHNNLTVEEMLGKYLEDFTIEDNYAVGYLTELETFKEIIENMKNKGFAFSIRDSDVRHKKKKLKVDYEDRDKNCDEISLDHHSVFYQLKALPIKFFGMPFIVQKTTHYHCAYGCKYYKSRVGLSKLKSEDTVRTSAKARRKRNIGSKKMGCLARMTLKSIIVYPEYKLENESDWRAKKKLIETLRKDLTERENSVVKFQRYYISASIQSSHNHPPIIITPKPMKTKKIRSQRAVTKRNKMKELNQSDTDTPSAPDQQKDEWEMELASTSLNEERETENEQNKILTLQDENFFRTLVKFPGTQANYEHCEYKEDEFQIEEFESSKEERSVEVQTYEFQTTISDLQLFFREKLKRLYTLSESCTNATLLSKLITELEVIEIHLSNDITSYGSYQ